MAKINKGIVATVLGLIVLSATGAALAGAKWIYEDVYTSSSGYAWGSLGYSRNTGDSVQYIGCSTSAWTTGTPYTYCSAKNAAGDPPVSCGTSNQQLYNAAVNLQGDSYLYFTWDSSGTCTYISSDNYSGHAPKAL